MKQVCCLIQAKIIIMTNCSLSCMLDPGVQFICGLSDVNAIINETAEVTCKLSSEDCEGAWFRDGKKVSCNVQTHPFLRVLCQCPSRKHIMVTWGSLFQRGRPNPWGWVQEGRGNLARRGKQTNKQKTY